MSLLDINNMDKSFNEEHILIDCNFSLEQGERIIITGRSGVGKTTFLNIVTLMDRGYDGDYSIAGVNVQKLSQTKLANYRNQLFGYVFQDFNLIEEQTVYQNILLPLQYNQKVLKKDRKKMIHEIATKLQINTLLDKKVKLLSGGQRQRVSIARACVNNPDIIVMDEPTSAIDKELAKEIYEVILKYIEENNKALILVTHSIEWINFQFDKHLILEEGCFNKY